MSGYTSIIDATPPFVPGTFDGQDVRIATLRNVLPGLFEAGDFAVTQRAAGANMSVDIAAGRAVVDPQAVARQGCYAPWMGTSKNTSSDGGYVWTAADATNPRIDLLGIEVADTDFGGSYTGWKFRVIDGTPNAGATHQLAAAFWPAIPAGFLPLAAIRVPNGATTLTTANITNLNPITGGRSAYSAVATAQTTTSTTYARLATPDFAFVYVPHANARIRLFSEGNWKISVASGTQGVALLLNGTQLKAKNYANGAPSAAEFNIASLGTFLSRFGTSLLTASGGATAQHFISAAGSTADVTNVTTGVAGAMAATTSQNELVISQLAAGWYLIEQQYKTSANTLTVANRNLWAEVVG